MCCQLPSPEGVRILPAQEELQRAVNLRAEAPSHPNEPWCSSLLLASPSHLCPCRPAHSRTLRLTSPAQPPAVAGFALRSFPGRAGALRRNRRLLWMEQEPPCSLWKHKCGQPPAPVLGVHPTEGLRSLPEPLRLTFVFPIFPVVSSLSSWKGSGSLILNFLLPLISLSRSLLKTGAGKKAEGSSLSPGFLFQD